jgi:putative ABC transport system substrate-binding protein
MDRRRFLAISLASAVATPLAATAQQTAKVWRIGYLSFTPSPPDEAFRVQLNELGYVAGRNLVVEYRWASPDLDRYAPLASELLDAGVDVIVAKGNRAVIAAKTVTGRSRDGPEQGAKKLEIFAQVVPNVARIAVVWNPSIPGLDRYWPPALDTAARLGITIDSVKYFTVEDLEHTWTVIAKNRARAVWFAGDPLSGSRRSSLCDLATQKGLPTIAGDRGWIEAGCLMTYAPDAADHHRRAAIYVDRIFRGATASDLPIERTTRFDFVINMKTAKRLRLSIPPSVLARVDHLIIE